jgi:hypothetical protein
VSGVVLEQRHYRNVSWDALISVGVLVQLDKTTAEDLTIIIIGIIGNIGGIKAGYCSSMRAHTWRV